MAALIASDVQKAWTRLVEDHLAPAGSVNLSKVDLTAAVNATNTWIDNNLASYLAALSSGAPAANAALTAKQKALLFTLVLMVKYGKL